MPLNYGKAETPWTQIALLIAVGVWDTRAIDFATALIAECPGDRDQIAQGEAARSPESEPPRA
jgi:hypothetical protein